MPANWTDGTSPCVRCGGSNWVEWFPDRADVRLCATCGNLATFYAIKSAKPVAEVTRPLRAPIEHPREAKFSGRYFHTEDDTPPIRIRRQR